MLLFVTQIKLALDDTILNTPSIPRGEVQDKIMFIISETRTYTVAKQKKVQYYVCTHFEDSTTEQVHFSFTWLFIGTCSHPIKQAHSNDRVLN